MAWPIVWSGLQGSPYRFQVGAQLVYQEDAAAGETTQPCRFDLFFNTPNSVSYNGIGYNWQAWTSSGQFASGSGTFNASGSNFTVQIANDLNIQVPVNNRSPLDWHFRVTIPAFLPSWSNASPSVTIDGWLPFSQPAAPITTHVTRVSDTTQRVTWPSNQNDGARIEQIRIRRTDITVNEVTIAEIDGNSTQFDDKTTQVGHRYRYATKAVNRSAESGWADSAEWVSTTPNAPTGAAAAKAANNTDIVLSWTNGDGAYQRQDCLTEVWHIPGGSAAELLATVNPGVTSWAHSAPNSVTHTYYLRHKTRDTPTLYAASAVSNTVALLAAPLAPSGIGPAVMDPADNTPVTWRHNPVDTTAQTAYEIQHRAAGGSTWTSTGKTTSGVSSWTFPAGTYARGTSAEVQVRTWGAHANPSPWSSTAVVAMNGRPSATNNVPAALTGAALTATHGYYDPEGTAQSSATWRLLQAGTVLETIVIDGPGTSAPFVTRLENGQTYTTDVTVRDGAGLTSAAASVTSTVTYLPPAVPAITAVWDRAHGAGQLTISYVDPDPVTQVATQTVEVWRDDILIASIPAPLPGAPVTVVDPIPASTGETYTVVAWSTSPSSASVDITLDPDPAVSGAAWINAGPGWSYVAGIFHDLKVDVSSERARDVQHFSGRAYPVEAIGEAIDESVKVSGRIPPGIDPATFRRVQQAGTTVCLRWPTGRRFVSLGGIDTSASGAGTGHTVGFTGTIVDHTE